jgi:hypothetical protein
MKYEMSDEYQVERRKKLAAAKAAIADLKVVKEENR